MAESCNNVLKQLRENWKGAPLDTVVCALHYVTTCTLRDVERGRCNMGDWLLKPEYRQTYGKTYAEFSPPPGVVDMHSIIPHLMNHIGEDTHDQAFWPRADKPQDETGLIEDAEEEEDDDDGLTPAEAFVHYAELLGPKMEDEDEKMKEIRSAELEELRLDGLEQLAYFEAAKEDHPVDDMKRYSLKALAKEVVASKRIHIVPSLKKCWVIQDSQGRLHAVTLDPLSCTCKPTVTCHHVMAARLANGEALEEQPKKPAKPNITLLRQNYRKPVDKRAIGKKIADRAVDICPEAASSQLSQTIGRPNHLLVQEEFPLPSPSKPEYGAYQDALATAHSDSIEQQWSKPEAVETKREPATVGGTETAFASRRKLFADLTRVARPVEIPKSQSTEPAALSSRRMKLYCICKQPYNKNGPPMVQCDGNPCSCVQFYHPACVNVPSKALESVDWTWVYKFCLPPVPEWGGSASGYRLDMTCPIDNPLSILYLYALEKPEFLAVLGTCKILKETMDEFMVKNFSGGKYLWAQHIFKQMPSILVNDISNHETGQKLTFWGTEREMFFDHLTTYWRALGTKSCVEGSCTKPTMESISILCLTECNDGSVQNLFRVGFKAAQICSSQRKNGKKCGHRQTFSDIQIDSDCFGFPVKLPNKAVDPRNIDRTVVTGNQRYALAGVTMYDRTASHYSAYVLWHNEWHYYDGKRTPRLSRLSTIFNDPILQRLEAGHALYLRAM